VAWLKAQFDVACDFRVIGSSTQFGISFNGYESWANFPHEQRRFLELLAEDAESRQLRGEAPIPTSFISGDVHYGEISALIQGADGAVLPPGLAPIWDITSSGITSTWSFATANDNRMQGPVMENNIGLLEFLPSDSVLAQASLWDATGTQRAFQVLAERNP
jgi:alkaline phosphatase D